MDGTCFLVPKSSGVVPAASTIARFYPQEKWTMIRGLFVGGVKVFYRNPREEEQRRRAEVKKMDAERQERYEKSKRALGELFVKLPKAFQDRIVRFRSRNPRFGPDYESYELFCCSQAVIIADTLKTPDAITKFHDAPWEDQKKIVPGIEDGHSGNTFGASCMLAKVYLEKPELLPRVHGALATLVGCKAYGCH